LLQTNYKDDCDFGLKAHHFTFVATKDFTSRDLGHEKLSDADAGNAYGNATIVNGKIAANNRGLMNTGVAVEKVAAATRTEIRKVTIQDAAQGGGRMNGQQRPLNSAVVFRHPLQAPSQPVTPVAQKVGETHPTLVHPAIAPRPVQPPRASQPMRHQGQPATTGKDQHLLNRVRHVRLSTPPILTNAAHSWPGLSACGKSIPPIQPTAFLNFT
jgi:hypothetical protein